MQRNCFQNQRLYLEKSPSASLKLLATNTLGSGFVWKTQQHCFQRQWGRDRKNRYRYDVWKNALQLCDFIKTLSKIAALVYFFTTLALEFTSPFSLRQSFGGKSSSARIYSQGVGSNLLVCSVLFDLLEKSVTMVSIV